MLRQEGPDRCAQRLQLLISAGLHFADADIVVLDDDIAYKLFSEVRSLWKPYQQLPIYRRSDFCRVLAVYHYGGLWLDATIVLLPAMCRELQRAEGSVMLCPMVGAESLYENYLIFASDKHHTLLHRWLQQLMSLIRLGERRFQDAGHVPTALQPELPYLSAHLALCRAVQDSPDSVVKPLHQSLCHLTHRALPCRPSNALSFAAATLLGVYRLLFRRMSCNTVAIKLRGVDRRWISTLYEIGIYRTDALLPQLLWWNNVAN
jgi:hypothetical protein